ncbi:MAG: universal stress protein, partial [Ignavibacteria bacterium]|nr:universal stress protein [Ignavibacteria bacterium]
MKKSRKKPVKKAAKQKTASQAGQKKRLVIKRILVPIDFSVHSKNALKYAVPMAEQFRAALRLVYVVEPTIYP